MTTLSSVTEILTHDQAWRGVLAYDEFSYLTVKRTRPPFRGELGEWREFDTIELRFWISAHYGITVGNRVAEQAVLTVAKKNTFHPVREYLGRLEWDGIKRVDTWFPVHLKSPDDAYHRAVGKKFLVGAVARVMAPPVKIENVLMLKVMRDVEATTVLSTLAGKDWYSEAYFVTDNCAGNDYLQGVWIHALTELDSFTKAELSHARRQFESTRDRYYTSFASRPQLLPRQCVMVGVVNNFHGLKISREGRRYWSVRCGDVDVTALASARDQLWAEALHLYQQDVRWWVTAEEEPLFEKPHNACARIDTWESSIRDWINAPDQRVHNTFTSDDIIIGALKMGTVKDKRPEQTKVGNIMRRLRWKKKRPMETDKETGKKGRVYRYVRPWDERLKPGDGV